MPKYRVRVHEEFDTEYLIDADTEEAALEEAERRNIDNPSGHGAEQSSCDRSCKVVSVES
jgi:hypothetical protein